MSLFHGAEATITGQTIIGITDKHAGLALLKPTQTPQGNWTASCMVTGHLVESLRGNIKF